jgi:hypothetical protein
MQYVHGKPLNAPPGPRVGPGPGLGLTGHEEFSLAGGSQLGTPQPISDGGGGGARGEGAFGSAESAGDAAEALGRIFILDTLLGNPDRLPCRRLMWRGNPGNLLYGRVGGGGGEGRGGGAGGTGGTGRVGRVESDCKASASSDKKDGGGGGDRAGGAGGHGGGFVGSKP